LGKYDVEYEYYKVPDVINNMSTNIDIPFVPILIYYCGSQFAYIRGNEKKGDSLYKMYVNLLETQVEEYSGPAQDGDPEYIEQTSSLDENFSNTISFL
jgi:coproporphyrinogen III oxidase-like Fe-S oxidoreductase